MKQTLQQWQTVRVKDYTLFRPGAGTLAVTAERFHSSQKRTRVDDFRASLGSSCECL